MIILLIFGMLLGLGVVIRTEMVSNYRRDLLTDVATNALIISREYLNGTRDWKDYKDHEILEGIHEFEKVGFGTMIWKFWKPLDSFWTPEQLRIMRGDNGKPSDIS